jgi:AmiR/NasT family two-component response regulator
MSADRQNGPGGTERVQELLEELRVRNGQLERALQSRVMIEQAKGVLAERYGITVDEAFELLRRAARSNHLKLHDLAAEVVASRETPPEVEAVLRRRRTQGEHAAE